MSAQAVEQVLASLYTDAAFRQAFLTDPRAACADADLTAKELAALVSIDRDGLLLAARSYAKKRGATMPDADGSPQPHRPN